MSDFAIANDSTATEPPSRRWFSNVSLTDKSLAATLELIYLRPLLSRFPASRKTALDIGAHRGEVTGELLAHGFRVLAVEPQEFLVEHLKTRFAAAIERGRLHLQRCAASDRIGTAELFVGSASTVSSLESEWTTVAFPSEFRSPRRVRVPLCTAGELLARRGWVTPGFVKIDVEGHELPVLNGLFDHPAAGAASASPPAIVMFEANHCFPERAEACLDVLRGQGYHTFDLFIRVGIDPVSACRAENLGLPTIWHDSAQQDFYANFIAYHERAPVEIDSIDPVAFLHEYQDCGGAK